MSILKLSLTASASLFLFSFITPREAQSLCHSIIMSGTLASDEIAEDYKAALEDLFTTDRYQISNLTTIARDNIEHAEAISRTLQNHITRACFPAHPVEL